jgi:hypothetical protein
MPRSAPVNLSVSEREALASLNATAKSQAKSQVISRPRLIQSQLLSNGGWWVPWVQ